METARTPNYLRFGLADKSAFEMNAEEIDVAAKSILLRAREKAFSRGRPIIFAKEGKLFEEWANGKILEIQIDS